MTGVKDLRQKKANNPQGLLYRTLWLIVWWDSPGGRWGAQYHQLEKEINLSALNIMQCGPLQCVVHYCEHYIQCIVHYGELLYIRLCGELQHIDIEHNVCEINWRVILASPTTGMVRDQRWRRVFVITLFYPLHIGRDIIKGTLHCPQKVTTVLNSVMVIPLVRIWINQHCALLKEASSPNWAVINNKLIAVMIHWW